MYFIYLFFFTLFLHPYVQSATIAEAEVRPTPPPTIFVARYNRRIAHIVAAMRPIDPRSSHAISAALTSGYNWQNSFLSGGQSTYSSTTTHPLSNPSSQHNPGYVQYQVDHKINYTNLLTQAMPLITTEQAHQQIQTLIDIDARTYHLIGRYSQQQWLDHFKAQEQFRASTGYPQTQVKYGKFTQYELLERFGLYPLKQYRQALESLPMYDEYMIVLARDLQINPQLRAQLQQIAERALALEKARSSVPAMVVNPFRKAFDIVRHIQAQAQLAQKRTHTSWTESAADCSRTKYTQETLAALQGKCSHLKMDLETTLQHTPDVVRKQEHQRFLSLMNSINAALPEACGHHPFLKEYGIPVTSKAYVVHVPESVNPSNIVGFARASVKTDPDHNHCFGNQVQIAVYKYAMELLEKVRSINKSTLSPCNREIVEKLITTIESRIDFTRQFNQAGVLVTALDQLQDAVDLYAYAQSIMQGSYNPEQIYSSEAFARLDKQVTQEHATLKQVASKGYSAQVSAEVKAVHERMLQQRIQQLDDLALAIKSVRAGNYDVWIQKYTLNQAALDLLHKNNISAAPFTRCVGNAYQQVRHAQMVALINRSADLCIKYSSDRLVEDMATATLRMSEKSVALSTTDLEFVAQLHNTTQAIFDAVSTVVQLPIDIATHVGKGALHGTQTVIHDFSLVTSAVKYAIMHDEEIVNSAIHAVSKLTDILDALILPNHPHHQQEWVSLIAQAQEALDALQKGIEQLPTPIEMDHRITEYLHQNADHLSEKGLTQLANDLAYQVGSFGTQILLGEGILRVVGNTLQLAKVSGIHIARIAAEVVPTLDEAKVVWQTAVNKLEKTVTQAEVSALATMEAEKRAAQAAGTELKTPFVYLNETLAEKHGTEKIAAKTFEKEAERKVAIEAKKRFATFNVTEVLKDIPAACKQLHASLGDVKKLEKAIIKFKDVPGAVGTDGPITRVLKMGGKEAQPGHLNRVRGSAYELERALETASKGEEVVAFGQQIGGREFDIVTKTRLIECKNVDWLKLNAQDLDKYLRAFESQAAAAKEANTLFEIHSKQALTPSMKDWFMQNNIPFIEG